MEGSYTIVFGDIANLGQLLKQVDNASKEILSRYKSVVYSVAEKYDGEVLDHFTDSSKIVFKNPRNAILYCLETFRKLSLAPRIPYRIGISYGNIHFNEDGILGEAAKIASRLVNKCPEGAVILTEEVSKHLVPETDFKLHLVGSTLIKGISDPINVFCIAEDGFYVPAQGELTEKKGNKNIIAILPFQNISSEKELDYICDGLAEEVIDRLTKSKDLLVTARSSSFLFRNRDESILQISRKLNAAYVLDGSIRRRNKEYRISYQLVDASTGYNVLSDTITSGFDSLYDSENTISKDILSFFNISEKPETETKDYYLNPVAYDYYLKGKHLSYLWTKETSEEAIHFFHKALEIFPDYALAYAGLSICYTHSAVNNFGSHEELFEKALIYADKALEADDTLHEPYIAKAIANFWADNWYLPDFEENLNKALQISPTNAEIRMFSGMLYLFKGDFERSLIELKLAKSLDPYSVPITIRLGLVQYVNKDYEASYNTFLSIIDVIHHHAYASIRLAWCCIQLEQYERALQHLDEAKQDHVYYKLVDSAYLVIYHRMNDKDAFFECKSRIEELDPNDVSYNFNQAILQKLLNKPEQSVHFLEKTLEDKMMRFAFVHFDPFWKDYTDLPEFRELVDKTYHNDKQKTIQLKSDTKEILEISLRDFIYAEAQDNYTLIILKKDKDLQNKILRATLSNIEKQLDEKEVIRCHRSYIINKNAGFQLYRENNKICLKQDELDIRIPVSRSKEKEVKSLIQK
jgi:TolB-like protein